MLKQSDTSIDEVSKIILNAGHDVAFLVPTETGMRKSIMDAYGGVRSFLKRNDIHDYDSQQQGAIRTIKVKYITNTRVNEKVVSLYRPKSKDGDPRIWIYGLNELANAYNLIALIFSDGELYVVNCSNLCDLERAIDEVIPKSVFSLSETALELLDKLKMISGKGFVNSVRVGDTGVGMTLESLLGIRENSSRLPDYKGIELKATRINKRSRCSNKAQLFSKTPNWHLSPLGSAENLVIKRGYIDDAGNNALRHTVSGDKPNSLGLFLDIDYANDYLRQMFLDVSADDFVPEHDMTWVFEDLRMALKKKHNETFWVKARFKGERDREQFHYVQAEYTATPYIDRLETLFETGLVTLDYTLHLKPSGKTRDHGYLFKLKPNSLETLFPKSLQYDLSVS